MQRLEQWQRRCCHPSEPSLPLVDRRKRSRGVIESYLEAEFKHHLIIILEL